VTAADHSSAPVTVLQPNQPPPLTQSVLVASSAVVPAEAAAEAEHSAAAAVPAAAEAADASLAVSVATVTVAAAEAASAPAVVAVQPTAHSCTLIHSANLTTQQLLVRRLNEAFWPRQTTQSTQQTYSHNINTPLF